MDHDVTWGHVGISRDRVSQFVNPRVIHIVDNEILHFTLRAIEELPIFKLRLMNGFSLGPHTCCSISVDLFVVDCQTFCGIDRKLNITMSCTVFVII